jgi:hypothetical protein
LSRPGTVFSFIPGKATLVRHFHAAKRRLIAQRRAVAVLPDVRIVSATDELNQIVDDIRDAPVLRKSQAPVVQEPSLPSRRELLTPAIHTVGKILRKSKIDK